MPNPFFDNRTSPNTSTAPNDILNEDSKEYSRGFSTFDLGRNFYNTLRYADITPHECVEAGFCKDKIPFGSRHEIRSHTLSSVLMSDIYMKKQYFAVDYRSFLPLNWQKILTYPVSGSDVPLNCNTLVFGLHSYLKLMCGMFRREAPSVSKDVWLEGQLRGIFLLECFLSNGSLLSSLGFHGASMLNVSTDDFDSLFDELIMNLSDAGYGFYYVRDDEKYGFGDNYDYFVSARDTINHIRSNFESKLFVELDCESYFRTFYDLIYNLISDSEFQDNVPFNYSRACAYKMIVSQFYTNDKIDSIYTNHMWLDNQDWILDNFFNGIEVHLAGDSRSDFEFYNYNGIRCRYDILSGNYVDCLLSYLSEFHSAFEGNSIDITDTSFYYALNFLYNLFSYDSSLRYGDYFTGAKARPLAVGDTDLVEVGEGVTTVEAVRRFSLTRFLNQVGRVGPRMIDYVKGVLKGVPAPDITIPRFLASVTSSVSGFEVENTAQNQGDIVTLLKSSDSNYIYEVEVGEPCIILGLTTFEIPRVYSKASDKFFFHEDRFDFFNPFLENVGDQDIKLYERALFSGTLPFAYTGRYMEYKQRFPYASGGFVKYLKSWLFITDNELGSTDNDTAFSLSIDSSYIRSKNSEMDRFYSSLTGYSLASYFHFIVKYQNACRATRQMQFNPQIL